MGAIAEAIKAGINRDLLIPVLPFDKDFVGKGAGKAPAKLEAGRWIGFDDWQHGAHDGPTILQPADQAGANVGLILGSPMSGHQFVALDVDLDDTPMALQWRNAMVAEIQKRLGQTLWVRETLPYRALLLFSLPMDVNPGKKHAAIIHHKSPKNEAARTFKVGKFELLTLGQQCVIGGIHAGTRKPITWHKFDGGGVVGERYPAPMVGQGVPTFASFDEFYSFVIKLLEDLASAGFTFQVVGANANGGVAAPSSELAPPSFDALIRVINAAPNPANVDYLSFFNFLMACAGARAGLIETSGNLTLDQETTLCKAVVDWGMRWKTPRGEKPPEPEFLTKKWNEDVVRPREERYAGWRNVMEHARAFGVPNEMLRGITMEQAQNQFKADSSVEPPPNIPGASPLNAEQLKSRAGIDPMKTVTADFAIKDFFMNELTGEMVWVPGVKQWFVWEGDIGWRSNDTSWCKVQGIIEDKLWVYAVRHGAARLDIGSQGWSASTFESILSTRRLKNVTTLLEGGLVKKMDDIDKGHLMLQTPRAMYDLDTLEAIPTQQRKLLLETRATAVEPYLGGPAKTEYFDKLILDLSDGNVAVAEWLLHYLGYCMLGKPRDAIFVVIYGSGGNGKSTLATVLLKIFGTYATSINPDVVQAGKNQHPASLNRLRGRRIALISELDKDMKWNERVLKQITGGDEIEARDMNKNPTPFRAQAGLLILANAKPLFSNVEPAIQRRFRLINTVVQRSGADLILDMEDRVLSEAPAILRKLMLYAQSVYRNGMPKEPPEMRVFADELLMSGDSIYAWMRAETEYKTPETAECYESLEDLKARYESYLAKSQKESPQEFTVDKISTQAFNERLEKEGISLVDPTVTEQGKPRRHRKMVKGRAVYMAKGIRLKLKLAEAV